MARKKRYTARLMLRPFLHRDLEAFRAICLDARVCKTYMLPELDEEGMQKLLDRMVALSADRDRFVVAVCLEDQLIGWINDTEMTDLTVELGWAFHPDHWGKGYATEAVAGAMEQLKKEGFSYVYAGAFAENPASIRVMQKAGMHLLDRTEELEYRGRRHHCVYYGKEL